jgi:hypothetical protein
VSYQQYLEALVKRYGLTHVPAILVLNARAEKVDIVIGILDAAKIRAAIEIRPVICRAMAICPRDHATIAAGSRANSRQA